MSSLPCQKVTGKPKNHVVRRSPHPCRTSDHQNFVKKWCSDVIRDKNVYSDTDAATSAALATEAVNGAAFGAACASASVSASASDVATAETV